MTEDPFVYLASMTGQGGYWNLGRGGASPSWFVGIPALAPVPIPSSLVWNAFHYSCHTAKAHSQKSCSQGSSSGITWDLSKPLIWIYSDSYLRTSFMLWLSSSITTHVWGLFPHVFCKPLEGRNNLLYFFVFLHSPWQNPIHSFIRPFTHSIFKCFLNICHVLVTEDWKDD